MVGEISFSFIRNEHTGEQFSHFGDFDPNGCIQIHETKADFLSKNCLCLKNCLFFEKLEIFSKALQSI